MTVRPLTVALCALAAIAAGCGGTSASSVHHATLSFSQAAKPPAARATSSPVPANLAPAGTVIDARASARPAASSGTPLAVASASTTAGSTVLAPAVGGLPVVAGVVKALDGPFKPASGEQLASPILLVLPPLAGGNWVEITLKRGADGTGSLAYQARYPAGR